MWFISYFYIRSSSKNVCAILPSIIGLTWMKNIRTYLADVINPPSIYRIETRKFLI